MANQNRLTSQEYAIINGLNCPHCGSADIIADGQPDVDGASVYLDVYCGDCNSTWQDVYTLTGYDKLEIPQKDNEVILEFDNEYVISFLYNEWDTDVQKRQYTADTPQHAVEIFSREFPLAVIKSVALLVDWK